jgi:type I restriction enzyme R subunit
VNAIAEAGLEEVCLDYLRDLGWAVAHGPDLAHDGKAPERSSYADVVLEGRLRAAVQRLNPNLPPVAVDDVVKAVGRAESQVVISENWRVYQLLTLGVPVDYRDASGNIKSVRAALIDWDDPTNNDFLAVNQFTITQDGKTRRPDILHFVNGLPLGLEELKVPGSKNATLKGAHNQIKTYMHDIPALFACNAVCVISTGTAARMGTMIGSWEHYAPWKTIDGTDIAPNSMPQIEVLLRGVFDKARFLDLVRNFIVFSQEYDGLVKRVAKYHQFWAVNAAIERTIEASSTGDGRAGVVWHTQGSGKSLEMLFYSGKIMRNPAMNNPTLVLLTDRNDLDDQLFGEVFGVAKTLPETPVQATSRDNLRTLLTRNSGGIVFTTLQKFGLSKADRDAGRSFPALSERMNIVVIADEAHRSQYDFIDGLAKNLRDALPNASFIGFSGTPIEKGDKNTRQVFGDYIDIYDLTQAVEDGATVKVFYEARLIKVDLPQDALADIDETVDEATEGLADEDKVRAKTRWSRVEAIVGSDERIAALAADFVQHWETRSRDIAGKALVVTMSRRISVALYNEIVRIRPDWHSDDDKHGKIKVVITGSAADDEALQAHIRNKQRLRDLKKRATDPKDPLEIVIVRDMWLTGFDSPSMHTMYVDKPMKGAGLMQAIARVNRTFRDKPSGLVVDYIGIADDLRAALADYTDRDRKEGEIGRTIEDEVLPKLIEEHEVVTGILHGHDWKTKATSGKDKAYLEALGECLNFLLAEERRKDRFVKHARELVALFAASVPHPTAMKVRDDVAFFQRMVNVLAEADSEADAEDRNGKGATGAEVDAAIRQIVSGAIADGGVIDIFGQSGLEKPDLSLINDDFIDKMKKSNQPHLQIEMLRRLVNQGIRQVSKSNIVQDRKFSEMLEASLLRYQNRSLDAAEVIAELVKLAKELKAEAERGAKLHMNEAELAFYDAVRTNDTAILELGDEVLQAIARDLVATVRKNASIDWRAKDTVRAQLRSAVKTVLRRYKYPPDKREEATDLVIRQAEVVAGDWSAA